MCYTCGCGEPDNDHGDPRRITTRTFEEAAYAVGMDTKKAKENAKHLLEEGW
jgi:hypothetical protein